MDVVRTVNFGGERLPADTPHTRDAYSFAHWDGDALLVDATHLAAGERIGNGISGAAG